MKDELGGKTMIEFATGGPKTYRYLMDDVGSDKKAKGIKNCVIKRRLKFNDYKDCLLNNETVLKSQQRFKSEIHDVYILKKLIRFHEAVMMIKECKLLIELHHILMDTKESMQKRLAKQNKHK